MSSEQNSFESVPPECDVCGKEEFGRHHCGRCQSAYYCSQACQKLAWKRGHKEECATMQAQCNKIAARVVQTMQDTSLPAQSRVSYGLLEQIDGAGPYKAAVEVGLEDAVRQLFQEDSEQVVECYRGEEFVLVAYTQRIMCTLFRGQRKSGIRVLSLGRKGFDRVDGERIQSYVLSHPNALNAWLDASFEVIRVPFDQQVAEGELYMPQGHEVARDVAAMWNLVFANNRASRAILLGLSMEADADAVARAKAMASKLRGIFNGIWNAPAGLDPQARVESILNQLVAMIDARLREFNVDFVFAGAIGFEGVKKIMYESVGVPLGEKTIEKGVMLSVAEAQAAMASSVNNIQRA